MTDSVNHSNPLNRSTHNVQIPVSCTLRDFHRGWMVGMDCKSDSFHQYIQAPLGSYTCNPADQNLANKLLRYKDLDCNLEHTNMIFVYVILSERSSFGDIKCGSILER